VEEGSKMIYENVVRVSMIPRHNHASKRTRNRVREHTGNGHELYRVGNTVNHSLFHKPANLFECSCGWLGWLPKDEIIVENLFTRRVNLSYQL